MGLQIKDNIVEITTSGGGLKFSTDRLLSSIVFRQSGTITVTDYNYQAPIVIKEHPSIVSDPEKFFMFVSYNIYGGDINSGTETINGMGSVLLGLYKDKDGYFAGSMILDMVSTPGILYAKISKNVKSGSKIDWSNVNYASAPNITINYAIQYGRFASNLVPPVRPLERLTVDCLLIGGGGGGGGGTVGMSAGGGGAGEFKEFTTTIEVDRSYNLSVGEGGLGGGNILVNGNGQPGGTSRFYCYTALGGAGGANGSLGGNFIGQGGLGSYGSGSGGSGCDQNWYLANQTDNSEIIGDYYRSRRYRIQTSSAPISDSPVLGGSAGGSINRPIRDYYSSTTGIQLNPIVGPGFVNMGGNGNWHNAGGGGGAGGAGVSGQIPSNRNRDDPTTNIGGAGGAGYTSNITGVNTFYAAGGSGGTVGATGASSTNNIGGFGGSATARAGGNAVVNTGSGGGGKGFGPGENINAGRIQGLVTASGITITGNSSSGLISRSLNTAFLSSLYVNDDVLIAGQVRKITQVLNEHTATVNKAFDPPITNLTNIVNLTREQGSIGGNGSSGIVVLKLPTPYLATFSEGVIYEHITNVSGYNIYKITQTQTQYERVKILK